MSLESRYPAIADLRRAARRRIPHFLWEYLEAGTGDEGGVARNRAALDNVLLRPAIMRGPLEPSLATRFLGQDYDLPVGIAPVGLSGGIWPNAERLLARLAARRGVPFCLSTMAAQAPETMAADVGSNGWFQLYPPKDPAILADMLARIRSGAFQTLVLTVDVPVASRRERQVRSGLTQPPRLSPRTMVQIATCPAWAMGTLRHGRPGIPFVAKYTDEKGALPSTQHIGYLLRTSPDWDYLARLRQAWRGKLIVKGVLEPDDAQRCRAAGVDAVWVSNHAARQFDAAPAAINCLPAIRAAVGPDYPLIYDSGVMGGLDVLRALARGADFVMLGKAFHYGLGACGAAGAEQVVDILKNDLVANMGQMGVSRPFEARGRLIEKG